MRTNHRRGFVATDDRPNRIGNLKKYGTGYGDSTNGHRGLTRQKKGLKKYLRTRRRFHENSLAQHLARSVEQATSPLGPARLGVSQE